MQTELDRPDEARNARHEAADPPSTAREPPPALALSLPMSTFNRRFRRRAADRLVRAAERLVSPRRDRRATAADGDLRGWPSASSRAALSERASTFGAISPLRLPSPTAPSSTAKPRSSGAAPSSKSRLASCVSNGPACTHSPLDALGPANTAFSLVAAGTAPQPAHVSATAFLDGVSVDVYALAAVGRQPLPESYGRFGFGVASGRRPEGRMGDASVAVRVSATASTWTGSPSLRQVAAPGRPLSPAFTRRATLDAVDADLQRHPAGRGASSRRRGPTGAFCPRASSAAVGSTCWAANGPDAAVAAAAESSALARSTADGTSSRASSSPPIAGAPRTSPLPPSLSAGMRVERARRACSPLRCRVAARLGPSAVTASWRRWRRPLAESPTLNLGFSFTAFSPTRHAERARHLGGRPRAATPTSALSYRDDQSPWRQLFRVATAVRPRAIVALDLALAAGPCRQYLWRWRHRE